MTPSLDFECRVGGVTPIVPCPCYSFSLVYANKHLYDKYLNNESYEYKSNQLRGLRKSQFYTVVYLQVPYVMKFLLCTLIGEMYIIEKYDI